MLELLCFDKLLDENIERDCLDVLCQHLIGLFSANSGQISIQCSIFIASKIVKVYKQLKTPDLINIINLVITNTSEATIFCASYIFKMMDGISKSQIPRLINFILKQNRKDLRFASVNFLSCCFDIYGNLLEEFIPNALKFIKEFMGDEDRIVIIECINLLECLLQKFKMSLLIKFNFIDLINLLILINQKKELKLQNELSCLISKLAFKQLKSNSKIKKQSIEENKYLDLKKSLEVISHFKSLMKSSTQHFINLLFYKSISFNSEQLFSFITTNFSELLIELIPTMEIDMKYNLFNKISKEKISPENLQSLILLCPDTESINEIASIALLLASSNNRKASINFFKTFSKTHPTIILPYLRPALVFLAQPPDNDKNFENDCIGNIDIVYSILKNIPRIDEALIQNHNLIKLSLKNILTFKYLKSFSCCSKSFLILSFLPEKYSLHKYVTYGILTVISSLQNMGDKLRKSLVKSLLLLRSIHINISQSNLLIAYALSSPDTLTKSILISLEKIIPLSEAFESFIYETSKHLILSVQEIKPTTNTLKKFIKRTYPARKDIQLRNELIMAKIEKEQSELEQIVINFPNIFSKLNYNEKSIILKLIFSRNNIQSFLFLLQLSIICPSELPSSLVNYLFQSIKNTSNIQKIEVLCEILANLSKYNGKILNDIFRYINIQNNIASFILLSSIFMNCNVPIKYILSIENLLNTNIKIKKSLDFVVFAITSMLKIHYVQLNEVGFMLNQFAFLFEAINSSLSLNPIFLHLFSECLSQLIEVCSVNLKGTKFLTDLVYISLESIRNTPIVYSKNGYLICCKTVIDFAYHLTPNLFLNFETYLNSPEYIQLNACSTFNDMIKFIDLKLETKEIIQSLIKLCQKTNDQRVSQFLISILSNHKSIDLFIDFMKVILLNKSILESQAIEPTILVMTTILNSCFGILDYLALEKYFKTEYLDDMVSSICNSIQTNITKIQEVAFPVLCKIIETFQNKKSDSGERILDLYDVKFASAVSYGFSLNLDISGGFLTRYLAFTTESLNNNINSSSEILKEYINNLYNCKQRSSSYYSLLSHICIVSQKYPNVAKHIHNFLLTLNPIFKELIYLSIQMQNKSWKEQTKFRDLCSTFYSDFLPSFIWLQTITKSEIDFNILISFFIYDIKNSKEKWKIDGSINAIYSSLKYFGNKINSELLSLIICIIQNKNIISYFVQFMTNDQKYDKIREELLSLILYNSELFDPKFLAIILRTDSRKICQKYSLFIVEFLIDKIINEKLTKEISKLIFIILFNYDKTIISNSILKILKMDQKFKDIKLELITVGLSLKPNEIPLEQASKFYVLMFKSGSMKSLAFLLQNNQDIVISILSKGVAKASFVLSMNDPTNTTEYLSFISYIYHNISNNLIKESISKSIFKLCINLIYKFSSNSLYGNNIISQCIYLIKEISNLGNHYDNLDSKDKIKLIQTLQKHLNKALLRKQNSNLLMFSTNTRSSKELEWETLEII